MKLKRWVFNTIMSIFIIAICILTVYVTTYIYNNVSEVSDDNTSYVLRDMVDDTSYVVEEVNEVISKPYLGDDISIVTNFYNASDSSDIQEKSLILYEGTYMPSSGILYGSDNEFNVSSIYQGEVVSIDKNDAFGDVVTIKHDNDVISKYSSLKDIKVNVGDIVSSGDVIGVSSENKVIGTCKNMLYFELVSKGININPESYYGHSIEELV